MYEHTVKMASHDSFKYEPQEKEHKEGRRGRDGGKTEWKLYEVNTSLCLEDRMN